MESLTDVIYKFFSGGHEYKGDRVDEHNWERAGKIAKLVEKHLRKVEREKTLAESYQGGI